VDIYVTASCHLFKENCKTQNVPITERLAGSMSVHHTTLLWVTNYKQMQSYLPQMIIIKLHNRKQDGTLKLVQ